jgi:hypothetical protein
MAKARTVTAPHLHEALLLFHHLLKAFLHPTPAAHEWTAMDVMLRRLPDAELECVLAAFIDVALEEGQDWSEITGFWKAIGFPVPEALRGRVKQG